MTPLLLWLHDHPWLVIPAYLAGLAVLFAGVWAAVTWRPDPDDASIRRWGRFLHELDPGRRRWGR